MSVQIIEIQKDLKTGKHFLIWANTMNKPVKMPISDADAGTLILNNNFDKAFTDTVEKWVFREPTNKDSLAKRLFDFVMIHTHNKEAAEQAVSIMEEAFQARLKMN